MPWVTDQGSSERGGTPDSSATPLVHVIAGVVARYRRGQSRVGSVDGVDQLVESGPLIETEGHTSLGRLDLSVFRVVGLVELAQIDAVVAGGHNYVVGSADVELQLDVAAFSQGLDGGVNFVYGLAQCRPSVTRKRKNRLGRVD